MTYFDTDHLIVYAFMVVILMIGLWAGKGIKDIREYAIANRMFGTAALVLTYLATEVGGQGVINIAGEAGTTGIIIILAFMSFPLSFLIQGLFIAPKMARFKQAMTMGDVMGELYNENVKILVGIFGFVITISAAGAELVVLGIIFESFLGIDYHWGVLLGGIILTMYVMHGGIKSVTMTDVVQFITLLVLLPVLTATALKHAGGISTVFTSVPTDKLQIWQHEKFSYYLVLFLSFGVFGFNNIDPALVQRILMAKSARQIRNIYFTLAGFFTALFLVFMLIGLAGHQLYPDLPAANIVPHLIQELLPTGLRGLIMAGIVAVMMASIDSYLHSAGLSLVHDVIQPLRKRSGVNINELSWVRYTTLLSGIVLVSLGLARGENIYELVFVALEFGVPLLVFPFFTGVIGLRPNEKAFYTATGVTLAAFVLGKLLFPSAYSHFLPIICVIANGIVFLGMHIISNKGLLITSTSERGAYLWQPKSQSIFASLEQLIPTPQRIIRYSQRKVAQYGAPYILFGTFYCVNYTLPYFMWEHQSPEAYNLMLYLRLIGGISCGLLIVNEKWYQQLGPYLPTFWHLTLLYSIPFISTVMFLLTQGSVEWLINVAITIMFLIVLVDWLTFFILTVLGVGLGFLFYRLYVGPITMQLDFSTGYLLVYQGIFATLIGLLFARRKERRIAQEYAFLKGKGESYQTSFLQAALENRKVLQTLQGTGVERLLTISKQLHELEMKDTERAKLQALQTELIPMAFQLQGIDSRAQDYLRLHLEQLPIDQLLSTVQKRLRERGITQRPHYKHATQVQAITGDVEQLASLLTKSIETLATSLGPQHEEETPTILVALEDTQLAYPLPDVEKGYIKQVPALRIALTVSELLPVVQTNYSPNLAISILSESTQELEQLVNDRIIKAHYGYSAVTEDTLIYVIPVDVSEVRPRDLDKDYMELGATAKRADDHFKNKTVDAQEQEQKFLTDVAARSQADLNLIKEALELIKWYHGPVKRHSGEPFYLHPLAVAQIVLDYDTAEATIIGALLHDTVEDTPMQLQHIEAIFGKETAEMVDVVTHLQSIRDSIYKIKLSEDENLTMLQRTGSKRGLYVKLADRMHNMRTINGHKDFHKRKLIAEETLRFFVPLAEALGFPQVAKELIKRCLEVVENKK